RNRIYGESKLDITTGFEYLVLLLGKVAGYTVPITFASFVMVGVVGLVIYLAILAALFRTCLMQFVPAAVVAATAAMVSNFLMNNIVTHRAYRLRGTAAISKGLLAFIAACSIGAVNNIAVSKLLVGVGVHWALAGTAGMVVGSVWNYSVTAAFIWHI